MYFCLINFKWYLESCECSGESIYIFNLGIQRFKSKKKDSIFSYAQDLFQMVGVRLSTDSNDSIYYSIYDIYSGSKINNHKYNVINLERDFEYFSINNEDDMDSIKTSKNMYDWFAKLHHEYKTMLPKTKSPKTIMQKPKKYQEPAKYQEPTKKASTEIVLKFVEYVYSDFLSDDYVVKDLITIIKENQDKIVLSFLEKGYMVNIKEIISDLVQKYSKLKSKKKFNK